MPSPGIEPGSRVPQTRILSVELRGLTRTYTPDALFLNANTVTRNWLAAKFLLLARPPMPPPRLKPKPLHHELDE